MIALDAKALLELERAGIVERIAAEDAALATPPEDRGEDLTASQHPADVASDLTARETLLATERALREQLFEVDDALGRLARGAYGTCVDCGAMIPAARLAVRPQAARCIACQRLEERGA
ncbi:MAG TPA: TraR/DksA family transcriptional regulator [Candidatus Limnocylindria bacterium]|nr:TraR/DksA family transcriptional regulator [Candidatus Limnocylindria bacterium]